MPSPASRSPSTTPDCNFAIVIPTTLGNLSNIAEAILKSTQLSATLLSPLPTAFAPGPSRNRVVTTNITRSDNSSFIFDSFEHFDLFGVPFKGSGYTWLHILLTMIIVVAIMIVIIFGNALVIVAVQVDKSLKGIQNYFIVSLAVADLLVGLAIMPLSLAVELMGKWIFGKIACNLWLGGDVLLCTASILNLCMISIDRYWSVTLAGQYTARVRKRRVTTMIVLVWILSTVISLPPLAGWAQKAHAADDECALMDDLWYIIYSTCGSFYAPLIVMIVVYIRIFVIARRTARKSAFKLTKQLQKRVSTPAAAAVAAQIQEGLVALTVADDPAANDDSNHVTVNKKNSTTTAVAGSIRTTTTMMTTTSSVDLPLMRCSVENGGDTTVLDTTVSLDETQSDCTRQLAVYAADTGVVFSRIGGFRQRDGASSNVSLSTSRFHRIWREVLLTKYFRRSNRQNRVMSDSKVRTFQRQTLLQGHAVMSLSSASTARVIGPIGEGDELSTRSGHSCPNPRTFGAHMSNDSAIHLATALLGNVAMSLAILPTAGRLAHKSPTQDSLDSSSHSIGRGTDSQPQLTSTDQVPPNETLADDDDQPLAMAHSTSKDPIAKTLSEQIQLDNTVASSAVDATRRLSLHLAGDDSTNNKNAAETATGQTISNTTVNNTVQPTEKVVTKSPTKPATPRNKKVEIQAPISLAEEVERRKKRLAKERERRTTRILVIIMLSFVGCWFPFFTLYLVSALVGFHVNSLVFATFFWLGYFNSALNPVSYAAFNKDFRGAFKRLLKIK